MNTLARKNCFLACFKKKLFAIVLLKVIVKCYYSVATIQVQVYAVKNYIVIFFTSFILKNTSK